MLFTPYFGGCKYTNNFLFINNNIEIQYFELLISSPKCRLTHLKPVLYTAIHKPISDTNDKTT